MLLFLERVIKSDVQLIGNQFCQLVDFTIGHIQNPPDIADDPLCVHTAEGDDLGYVLVAAIFIGDIFDHLIASIHAEVDINIRHTHPFRIEESLEQQIVLQRIDISDFESISHHTACGRTTTGSDRNTVLLGVVDKIPHNEKITRIAHLIDDAQLPVQPLHISFPVKFNLSPLQLGKPFFQTLTRAFSKIGLEGIRFRDGVFR